VAPGLVIWKKMEEEAEVVDAEENIPGRMKRLRPRDEKRLTEGQKSFKEK
jgi:hypothetical protein